MSESKRNVWIYSRMGNRESSSTEIDARRKQIEAYAYARGFKVLGCTEGTGRSLEIAGPEMEEIELAVEKMGVNTLLVKDMACLTRRTNEMLGLIDHLKQMGVKIETTQGEELSNPGPIEKIKMIADLVTSIETDFGVESGYEDYEDQEEVER